jgi:hypothetical protein
MYFERVLVYPAAFINDISLMNFSASPLGLPCICCSAFSYVFPSLIGLVCLTYCPVSILFYLPFNIR